MATMVDNRPAKSGKPPASACTKIVDIREVVVKVEDVDVRSTFEAVIRHEVGAIRVFTLVYGHQVYPRPRGEAGRVAGSTVLLA